MPTKEKPLSVAARQRAAREAAVKDCVDSIWAYVRANANSLDSERAVGVIRSRVTQCVAIMQGLPLPKSVRDPLADLIGRQDDEQG